KVGEAYYLVLEKLDKLFPDKDSLSTTDVCNYLNIGKVNAVGTFSFLRCGKNWRIPKEVFAFEITK
ncbi:MAG: hypothetical protein RR198_08305, partial [Oscillospiraceae bacterium]